MMVTESPTDTEYTGLLQRDEAGFMLQCDDNVRYRLELIRTPIDEVEKRVIVTGRVTEGCLLEAEGVRLA